MIVLKAEVDDPEVLSTRRGESRFADCLIDAAPAQLADGTDHPQRDVNRIALVQERPRLVRRTSPLALGRTPGAPPLAAAPEQLLLDMSSLRFPLRRRRPHGFMIAMRAQIVN